MLVPLLLNKIVIDYDRLHTGRLFRELNFTETVQINTKTRTEWHQTLTARQPHFNHEIAKRRRSLYRRQFKSLVELQITTR